MCYDVHQLEIFAVFFCTVVRHQVALAVGLALGHTPVLLALAGLVHLEAPREVAAAVAAVVAVHLGPGHGRSTDDLVAPRLHLPDLHRGNRSEALALHRPKYASPSSHAISIRGTSKKFLPTMER